MEFRNGFKNWPPKRIELLNWFRDNAATLAEAYEGAVRLIEDIDFPGRLPFIAHAVRDIVDRLAFVLEPQLEGKRVQYENEMDQIVRLWPDIKAIINENISLPGRNSILIDLRLASRIDGLVQAHRERLRRPSIYELLFGFLMRNEPYKADVNQRLVSDLKDTREWFMKHTHLREKEILKPEESELQTQFRRFEGMLHSFVGNFFTGTVELDEILQQANK